MIRSGRLDDVREEIAAKGVSRLRIPGLIIFK